MKKSSAFCGAERSTFSRLPLYSALQLDLLMICTQSNRVCEGPDISLQGGGWSVRGKQSVWEHRSLILPEYQPE